MTAVERDDLVVSMLPRVRYVANKFRERLPPHVDADDLYGAGVLGLIDAAGKYDGRESGFKAFANLRVNGAIYDWLRETDWAPRAVRRQSRDYGECVSEARQRLGRDPEEQEIAEAMGITLAEVQELRRDIEALTVKNLDEPIDDESGVSLGAMLAGPEGDNPETQFLDGEARHLLRHAIDRLNDQERHLVDLLYFGEATMHTISQKIGVSRSRVSQMHSTLLPKLRQLVLQGKVRAKVSDDSVSPVFGERVCVCGCGETFMPTGPRQVFVFGHRMPLAQPQRFKADGTPKRPYTRRQQPVAKPFTPKPQEQPGVAKAAASMVAESQAGMSAPTGQEVKTQMVMVQMPLHAVDKLLMMMPLPNKLKVLEEMLADV